MLAAISLRIRIWCAASVCPCTALRCYNKRICVLPWSLRLSWPRLTSIHRSPIPNSSVVIQRHVVPFQNTRSHSLIPYFCMPWPDNETLHSGGSLDNWLTNEHWPDRTRLTTRTAVTNRQSAFLGGDVTSNDPIRPVRINYQPLNRGSHSCIHYEQLSCYCVSNAVGHSCLQCGNLGIRKLEKRSGM